MKRFEELETSRLALLDKLDAAKTQVDRNRLGQFATPPELASEIIAHAVSMIPPKCEISFLEPGFGTGPFYSALLRHVSEPRIATATGYETDAHYACPAMRLWSGTKLHLHLNDFTEIEPPAEKYNLVVCNPPYVRHHHLRPSKKRELQARVALYTNSNINGLSGLYTYFLILSQAWMQEGGVGAWLVPSEFMDVNYGRKVKEFLLDKTTLEHIHRFDPNEVQFRDAMVSSAIVFFRNSSPARNHKVKFTFGGTLANPLRSEFIKITDLQCISKWTGLHNNASKFGKKHDGLTLSDLFSIKRGIATGCNSFFILTPEQAKELNLPEKFLRPILPSPRELDAEEILSDENGEPQICQRRFLLSCALSEDNVRRKYPTLWAYLEYGIKEGVHQRYLCRHRKPWYCQEQRLPSLFLCTYMGRQSGKGNSPFRFILNHSKAIAANVYLMLYPKPFLSTLLNDDPQLSRLLWKGLSSINGEVLINEGRVYGGGLHKIEPKELANVPANVLLSVFPKGIGLDKHTQSELFAT